jgi:hypothetical protein
MSEPTIDVDATRGGIPAEVAPAAGAPADPYLADELHAGAGGDEPGSVLELLESELAQAEPEVPTVRLALKRRPDYVVVYRINLDGGEIERARAQSRDRKKVDGVDGPKFAGLIAVTACLEIWRRGVRLEDEQGRPLRFNHRAFLQAFEARSAVACAQAFYRNDAELDAVARRLMTDSGWGEDVQDVTAVDPPDDASSS